MFRKNWMPVHIDNVEGVDEARNGPTTCSVVIPTIRQAQVLSQTLDSLALQSERNFEVIVVCDGEDPRTRALSQSYSANYPLKWIFFPHNCGLPSARNAGVLAAKGKIIIFLDDDTSAARDLVYQHRRHHETWSTENGLVVYGALVYLYSHEAHTHTERFLRTHGERSEERIEAYLTRTGFGSAEVDHLYRAIGTNCSIGRSTFLKHNGFDSQLRRGEDFELGSRLYDGGTEWIFEPRAIGYHTETKDLSEHFRGTCEVTGRMNAYRSLKNGERNAQTRGLTSVRCPGPLRRLKMYSYWHRPDTLRAIAGMARKITDATGLKFSYEIWRRLEMATGYWQGVKSAGLALEDLREFVGRPFAALEFDTISVSGGEIEKKYILSPRKFRRIMRLLNELNYSSVGPAEALSAKAPSRLVVLTFQGYAYFYTEVFPYLDAFRIRPVVFLAANSLVASEKRTCSLFHNWLSYAQVREMQRSGVQFGSCGLSHCWLPDLSDADLDREIVDSKARLESLLGSEVNAFVYPGGGVNARVRAAVARAGYKFGFSSREGLNLWEDPLCLRRLKVTGHDTSIGTLLGLASGRSARSQTLQIARFLRFLRQRQVVFGSHRELPSSDT
jgi:glycosyltransferase involved in cell wall biosynthesis